MSLLHILVFTAFALVAGWLLPQRWRSWVLLGGSVLAIYWLQPAVPIRQLDFWLPTVSIGLTIWVWAITYPADVRPGRIDLAAAVLITGIILALALSRYLGPVCCLTPNRPPALISVLLSVTIIGGVWALTLSLRPRSALLTWLGIAVILALFAILKSELLGQTASLGLRRLSGQDASLANFLDLRWLGFSYLAFRLLHVLRDAQAGRLPAFFLGDFAVYALFFPAYTAGPIDRAQRFIPELRGAEAPKAGNVERFTAKPLRTLSLINIKYLSDPWRTSRFSGSAYPRLVGGLWRILVGVFKKFALADSLALLALNEQNATQVASTGWTWLLLYAYALRLYFDFSGYTDIALGLGRLAGIKLPENFSAPYLKTNLTAFWNGWHITLAQWFRAYVFNPFTRALRARRLPVIMIILAGQLLTMLLIGLWHGITVNFALWGLWHGAGLFLHNRWADWSRGHPLKGAERPQIQPLLKFGGWFLTFHYVVLGWVWFALPEFELAVGVFRRLFGI